MKTVDLQQGTDAWHAFRASHFTASEAPAMMGASKYQTRADLLKQKATGHAPDVSAKQQAIFDRGHAAEAAARPFAESMVGQALFPATGESDEHPNLSASFDGITMDESVIWEHKLFNERLAEVVRNGEIEAHYFWQLEHQLLVSGAERCLFMVSDGTEERMVWDWYESVPERREALLAGWKQFDEDLANYTPPPADPVAVARATTELPALHVEVKGQLEIANNFRIFEERLSQFLAHELVRHPETDEDFATLDSQIKALKKAEEALAQAEASMLAQVSEVEQAKRTKDALAKLVRDNRLMAEKLLASEKECRRNEIRTAADAAFREHIASLEATFGGRIKMPDVACDIAGAMKGKKTVSSLRDAADTTLAAAKIEANRIADRIRLNLETLRTDAAGFERLFADAQQLVMKENDDLKAVIALRIREHKEAEEKRLEAERERIRQEEQAKLQRQAEAEARPAAAQKPAPAPAEPATQQIQEGADLVDLVNTDADFLDTLRGYLRGEFSSWAVANAAVQAIRRIEGDRRAA